MTDNQVLAAVQEILLKARIRFTTGTEAEWSTANPVLLDGEWGLVRGTSPLKFKVGDGTKNWGSLGWGNVTSLAQLAADANHRLVTDAEKSGWNNKANTFEIDCNAYYIAATAAAQKQIAKNIFGAVSRERECVVIARNVLVPNTPSPVMVDGLVLFSAPQAAEVTGIVQNFAWSSTNGGKTMNMVTAQITFKSDGTISITKIDMPQVLVGTSGLPSYTLEKVATESGYASTYHLKKDGQKVGASINIPLDQVLRGSSIKSVTTAGAPYTGAKVGDKYIEFLFQNNSTPQYLPVQDLVDVYKGDNTYIQVSAANVIKLDYAALKSRLQPDFGSVFDTKGAGVAAAKTAVDDFKASSFIIQCTIPGMS